MAFENIIYENDIIYILIDEYKKLSKCDEHFNGSASWDETCGLYYLYGDKYRKPFYIPLKIVNEHKFFLAKIKYGI
jgi:hypothetical protein